MYLFKWSSPAINLVSSGWRVPERMRMTLVLVIQLVNKRNEIQHEQGGHLRILGGSPVQCCRRGSVKPVCFAAVLAASQTHRPWIKFKNVQILYPTLILWSLHWWSAFVGPFANVHKGLRILTGWDFWNKESYHPGGSRNWDQSCLDYFFNLLNVLMDIRNVKNVKWYRALPY